MTTISKHDLDQHVWLVQEVRQAKHTPKLEALGFNYFSRSKDGMPLAWRLVLLEGV